VRLPLPACSQSEQCGESLVVEAVEAMRAGFSITDCESRPANGRSPPSAKPGEPALSATVGNASQIVRGAGRHWRIAARVGRDGFGLARRGDAGRGRLLSGYR